LPTKVTVLKSEIRPPPQYGDTVFADTHAAYDGLSEEMKQQLKGLQGTYSYLKLQKSGNLAESEAVVATIGATHPLVTTHPITGRRNIYANPSDTVAVVGYSREQSDELLQFLFNHTAKSEYSYRHKYEDGDLLLWDNRAVQHRATRCPDEFPRKLVRTTASNDDIPRENISVTVPFDLAADRQKSEYYHNK